MRGLAERAYFRLCLTFGRLLRGLLYGVHPLDPGTLLLSTLLLLGLAALAAYVPARRAARLDPVDLLRTE